LNLVPLTRFWSPHYLYVATAFAALLIAGIVDKHKVSRITAVAVIALFGAISFHIGYRYRDDTALWTPEAQATPECREAHFFLAEVARERRDWDSAARSYELAIASSPHYLAYADVGAALQNLGAIRLEQRDWPAAKAAFSRALEHSSDPLERRQITHNLAVATLQSGDATETVRLLDAEAARTDALPQSLFIRARALHDLGREQEAIELLRRIQHKR
jgi:tetratricopeptide (TPR) repeat protein